MAERPAAMLASSLARDAPRCATGPRCDRRPQLRALEGVTRPLYLSPQYLRLCRGARCERDGRPALLAELVGGQADDGRLGDRGMLVQDLLDLARVDVVAAADDHLLLAVHDEEVAIGVHPRQVTSPEPAVRDRLGGGLRLAP